MDELDRLLADALHDAASRAPSDAGLLGTVRERSRRYRRRQAAALGAVAVLAAGIPFVVVLAAGPRSSAPLEPVGSSPVASASARPASLQLVAGYTAPVFPYTLPASAGLKAPATSMRDGNLIALFEATEQKHHADITVTVSTRKPAFSTAAAETPIRVRGHAGFLRTVDVQPARQYTLYWPESAGRWIQLATDDTYTIGQVVGLAAALSPASIAVPPPFTLDLAPAGLPVDTVTDSTVSFGGDFRTVLRKRRPLSNPDRTVGGYRASLVHSSGRVTLDVDVTDWNATLEITVGAGRTITDADLLRYAAGVHILNRSNPS
ncbi:hypothetical protein [Actinoplanes subtropicus]|uniref:hypothetical protein n=1 Tax=Actinoplanes subtropicus TaxID=543632 RepID=UPI0004C3BD31|nr:hypothetical protein [Actinoplanes subtropicus]